MSRVFSRAVRGAPLQDTCQRLWHWLVITLHWNEPREVWEDTLDLNVTSVTETLTRTWILSIVSTDSALACYPRTLDWDHGQGLKEPWNGAATFLKDYNRTTVGCDCCVSGLQDTPKTTTVWLSESGTLPNFRTLEMQIEGYNLKF